MDTQLNIHIIGEAVAAPFPQPLLPSVLEQTARQVFETFSEKMKAALNGREERALKLALEGHVTHKAERVYSVRSEDSKHAYLVDLEERSCTCPDYLKGNVCKHRLAAYLVEQATKATQEIAAVPPEPQIEQPNMPGIEPDEDAMEKARLALHARSQYLRESIIYALLEVDGQSLQVEVVDIDGEVALVRALPALKDGKLIPQFPFPDKKSFAQVISKSLREVKIYR
jgi:hypothetical protein